MKIMSILLIALFFLSLATLLISVSKFWAGYHNLDLSYNFKGTNVTDTGTDGVERSINEVHLWGLNEIAGGFLVSVASSFILGFSCWKILNPTN